MNEAHRLNIPTFAIVDTNANPKDVDFAIPANDDAAKSIELIVKAMTDAVAEGLAERKAGKTADAEGETEEEEAEEVVATAKAVAGDDEDEE